MAEYTAKDASGNTKYFKAGGAGTTGDGFETQVATGATDDAAAAGAIFPLAGLYQTTIDEVDAGDVGRLRMSARRGLVMVPDYKIVTLSNAAETPTGSDLSVTTGIFLPRDTSTSRYIVIPLASAGFNNIQISFYISTAFDQAMTFSIYAAFSTANNATAENRAIALLASVAAPTSAVRAIFSSSGAVGQGGATGGATIANSVYSIPAMTGTPYIALRPSFSVAPTVGEWQLSVARSSL